MKHAELIKLMTANLRFKPEVVSVPVEHEVFVSAKPKQCYSNAFLYVMGDVNFTYVLGYMVLDIGVPIEHAWVKSSQGHLDVTMAPQDGYEYYPLAEISFQEVCEFVVKHGFAPSLYDYNRFIFKE